MAYSGSFTTVGNVSSVLNVGREDSVTITLTNVGGHVWSAVLEESVGGQAWRVLATYSSDQSAGNFQPAQQRAMQARLRLVTVNGGDSITFVLAAVVNTSGHTVTLVDGEPQIPPVLLATDDELPDLALPTTQTATVDTDVNTFEVEHVFDLGKPRTVHVKMTILSFDADGETPGAGSGTISVDIGAFTSQDGVTYQQVSPILFQGSPPPFVVGGTVEQAHIAARYLKVITIIYSDDAIPPAITYPGANHPTAQVRLDVTY